VLPLRKPVGCHTQRQRYDFVRSISSLAIPLLSLLSPPSQEVVSSTISPTARRWRACCRGSWDGLFHGSRLAGLTTSRGGLPDLHRTRQQKPLPQPVHVTTGAGAIIGALYAGRCGRSAAKKWPAGAESEANIRAKFLRCVLVLCSAGFPWCSRAHFWQPAASPKYNSLSSSAK
jgi:hypothetical protein